MSHAAANAARTFGGVQLGAHPRQLHHQHIDGEIKRWQDVFKTSGIPIPAD